MAGHPVSKDARGPEVPSTSLSVSDAERCSYIAEMCLELRELAARSRLRDLNYLLDLARAEAEYMAKQLQGSDGRH